MGRSKWKGPFLNNRTKKVHTKNLEIMGRNSLIVPSFVGFTYNVHNGKNYFEISVNENMIGHKFGEFCFTRAKFFYKKKKLKK
jgi:small subunit ribosomal protein S19